MKINGEEWKKMKDEEKIAYCEELFSQDKSNLEKHQFEWYLNYLFIDGKHYSSYNTVTNTLETKPRKRNEVRLVINKVKSNIRAVKNYVTRTEPKWEIIPGDLDEDTIKNARRAGKFMDYWYRITHFESNVSGIVDLVLNTSVAWVEPYWDDNARAGLGDVKCKLHDSFDIYPDVTGYLDEGKFRGSHICKAVKRDLDAIHHDEKYIKGNRAMVVADDEVAASEIKSRMQKREHNLSSDSKRQKATVKEFHLYSDEKNGKGGNIQLFTYSGDKVLRDEETKHKEFNLYVCQIDLNPLKVYQKSWTADAIPLNKALDRTVSQKLMYVNQALIYRIIAEKGHGVTEINNEMGVVYEINKNRKFEQMQMGGLPSTIDSMSGDMERYIEDVLGSHEASFGANPAGVRSGKTLEALQAADSNNLAGIIQSLNSFLSVLGSAILDIVAEKYTVSRIAKITEPELEVDPETGEEKQINNIKVIGGSAPDKVKDKEKHTIINKDNELIVKIGSWLGYTVEQQRETLMELGDKGYIPKEEVIRQLEFANINELSEKARGERLEEHTLKAEIAGRNQGQGGQGGGQPDTRMIDLADKENTEMANGAQLPPTEGADMQHTQAHIDFTQTETFQSLPPEAQQIFIQHIQGEKQMYQ